MPQKICFFFLQILEFHYLSTIIYKGISKKSRKIVLESPIQALISLLRSKTLKKSSKILIAAVLSLFATWSATSLELTFRLTPGMGIPLSESYTPGLNTTFQVDADLFGFLTAGAEGHFSMLPMNGLDGSSYMYGGGIGIGAYYYPISRLYLGLGAAGGIYQLTPDESSNAQTYSDIYARAYAEAGFRFTPSFVVSANVGFGSYMLVKSDGVTTNMLNAGIGVRYSLPVGKGSSSGISVSSEQMDSIYPLFMHAYNDSPATTIILRNGNGAEISNVKLKLTAGKYGSSTADSGFIHKIKKYSSVEIPICMDFNSEILKFTETGKILCDLQVEYEMLGKKMHSNHNVILSVASRNAFSWGDASALSSFISSETQDLMEFAKAIAGDARNYFYTGMSRNLQEAAALMEALRLGGVRYSGDRSTPYVEYHLSDKIDYVQYPMQTLNSLSGDYDDLGILLASCLETVQVPTGYITVDDDFILLVATGSSASVSANMFADPDSLLDDGENVYFGLSMAKYSDGFTASRLEGAKKIKAVLAGDYPSAEFVNVHSAWDSYTPVIFSENGNYFERPASSAVISAMKKSIDEYINSDLSVVLAKVKRSGDHNKIGVALVRMGRYAEARAEFQKDGSIKSLNNLANVYMIEKNYSQAAATYRKVLAKDPENSIAIKGLESASSKLSM